MDEYKRSDSRQAFWLPCTAHVLKWMFGDGKFIFDTMYNWFRKQ